MLPTSLAGSYRRYKADTAAFTTWLSETAIKCGWTPPHMMPLNSGSKDNPSTGKYAITTKDLTSQAEVIAASSRLRVQIPSHVIELINRCVRARERCSAWFYKTGSHEEAHADEGHAHFVQVLKDIVRLLEPCTIDLSPEQTSKRKVLMEPSTKESPRLHSQNSFEALEVEDIDVMLQSSPSHEQATNIKKHTEQIMKTVDMACDTLACQSAELTFSLFCFLEDAEAIQSYLVRLWHRYQSGDINIMTASTVTNAALQLIRTAEQDLLVSNMMLATNQGSFHASCRILFKPDKCLDWLRAPLTSKDVDFYFMKSSDDIMRLSTARVLLKWLDASADVRAYPWAIRPLAADCLHDPGLLKRPEVQAAARRENLLLQMLIDMRSFPLFLGRLDSQGAYGEFYGMDDMFRQAERNLTSTRKINLWSLFTCHVLSTVNEILGHQAEVAFVHLNQQIVDAENILDQGRMLKRLQSTAYSPEFRKNFTCHLELVVGSLFTLREIPKLFGHARDEFLAGCTPESITVVYPDAEKQQTIPCIMPAKNSDQVFSRNILRTGQVILNVRALLEQVGMRFANYNQTLLAMSHLYSAARHMKLVVNPWPAMETHIEQQMRSWFGSAFPDTLRAIFSRYMSRVGYRESQILATIRSGLKPWVCPTMTMSPQHKCRSSQTIAGLVSLLQDRISREQWLYKVNRFIEEQGSRKPLRNVLRLQPLTFLPRFEEHIQKISSDMLSSDYLSLTRESEDLLRHVRATIIHRCADSWPDNVAAAMAAIPADHTVQLIFADCISHGSIVTNHNPSTDQQACAKSEMMQIAAEWLDKYTKRQQTKMAKAGMTVAAAAAAASSP